MIKTVNVPLGDRSYPIHIGKAIFDNTDLWRDFITPHQKICIVTNTTVAPLYLDKIRTTLLACAPNALIVDVQLKDGEQYKNGASIDQIYDTLMAHQFNRDSLIVALGGGVVGDMAGFAAASFLRGIDFIQVPTTLLAQVDSSVGGKTGINHPLGKNMIGAFHQPKAVMIDINSLKTLEPRQISAGLAEVIKYGLIIDVDFFHWLNQNISKALNLDSATCTHIIERSCQIKADVVMQDEKEHGVRAWLNLGHTFGHAIESEMKYQGFLHGEAIAVGMVMAATLSHKLEKLSAQNVEDVKSIFKLCSLPIEAPEHLSRSAILQSMATDKKVLKGQIRLILMESIGKAYVSNNYDQEAFIQILTDFFPTE